MSKRRIAAFFLMLLTVVWLFAIYGFSGEDSGTSDETSGAVTEAILNVTVKDFSDLPQEEKNEMIDKYNHPVRKLAHFSEYIVLGFLTSLIFLCFDFKSIRLIVFPLTLSALCAAADEIHQIFVPGRSCQFTDVLIDSSGALLGILIIFFISILFKKKKAAFAAK